MSIRCAKIQTENKATSFREREEMNKFMDDTGKDGEGLPSALSEVVEDMGDVEWDGMRLLMDRSGW